MTEGTFTLCPYCQQRVEPEADGVVYARERVDIGGGFGQTPTHEIVEGKGGFFHPDCPPELIGWVRRSLPEPR
jgi:hypothetical protein